jgi:hypothetical protein
MNFNKAERAWLTNWWLAPVTEVKNNKRMRYNIVQRAWREAQAEEEKQRQEA